LAHGPGGPAAGDHVIRAAFGSMNCTADQRSEG
jgi:hypothetical protein